MLCRSQWNFAHITIVTLSGHVLNFIVIGCIYLKPKHSKIWSNSEFDRNIISGRGAWSNFPSRICHFKLSIPGVITGLISRFAPSQWETPLLCNDVSHWLGACLESALDKVEYDSNKDVLKPPRCELSVQFGCITERRSRCKGKPCSTLTWKETGIPRLLHSLIHYWDKMAAILQMVFSNSYAWTKSLLFQLKFHWFC